MNVKKTVIALFTVMFSGGGIAAPVTGNSADVNFSLNVLPPGCTITAPQTINLTDMKVGSQAVENSPFNITLNCDVAVPTALSASVVAGTRETDTSVALLNGSTKSGAVLELLDNGNGKAAIYLTGDMAQDKMFCQASSTSRTCSVIPKVTLGTSGSLYGQATASIKFTLVYT